MLAFSFYLAFYNRLQTRRLASSYPFSRTATNRKILKYSRNCIVNARLMILWKSAGEKRLNNCQPQREVQPS
jgi:hypothetical protein